MEVEESKPTVEEISTESNQAETKETETTAVPAATATSPVSEPTETVEMAAATSEVKPEVESVSSPTPVPASPAAAKEEDKASPSKSDSQKTPVDQKPEETAGPAAVEAAQPPLPEDEKMDTEESKPTTAELSAESNPAESNATETTPAAVKATPPASEAIPENIPDMAAMAALLSGDSAAAATPVQAEATKVKGEKKGANNTASKIDLQKAPVRQYLDVTVVPALLAALSAVARERPANPITFLGDFLHNFAKQANEMAE